MKRILMIGGGYVNVYACKVLLSRLRRQLARGDVSLTLVSADTFHSFHGWTGEVIGGILSPAQQLTSLRRLLKGVTHLSGRVAQVDLAAKTVLVKRGNDSLSVPFDELVVGTGSYERTCSIPGLEAHGWLLRSGGHQSAALKDHLLQQLERAELVSDPQLKAGYASVVVAGGGLAGVELVANIAELFRSLRPLYPSLTHARLVLCHSQGELLKQLRPRFSKIADYAQQQVEAYGVEIKLEDRLLEVSLEGSYLESGFIPAATVIACSGQRAAVLPGLDELEQDEVGRLRVDETLRVANYPFVWAGGDVAHVKHPVHGDACPANALWAIVHGCAIGRNLARTVQGQALQRFKYRGLGQALNLGVGKGAVELYGMQFQGWLAYLMRLGFFLHFMPSRTMMFRAIGEWLSFPFTGRIITPVGLPKDLERLVESKPDTRALKELA